jgi:Ca2+-transporting ATPase
MLTGEKYGSTKGIFKGLTSEEVEQSRRKHGNNLITSPPAIPWWRLLLEKFADPIIRILLIAAILAIAMGVIDGNYGEGMAIIMAILLATLVAFGNEYQANKEFAILNQTNNQEEIEVLRNGYFTTIAKQDLVVGDLVVIETGQEIPADGKIIDAVSLEVDESKLTGEDRSVSKGIAPKFSQLSKMDTAYPRDTLLRGTMVVNGHGIMKLSAVGDETEIGKTSQTIQTMATVETPLNIQLARLSRLIEVLGLLVAVLIEIALVVRGIISGKLNLTWGQWYIVTVFGLSLIIALICIWLPILYDGLELSGLNVDQPKWLQENRLSAWLTTILISLFTFAIAITIGSRSGWISPSPIDWIPLEVGREFLTYFMIAVAVIVVAVPEGLALSVTLSLGYSMHKMTKHNNLVRKMHACETIGAATVICSDKTGTLTRNEMRISQVNIPCLEAQTNLRETNRGQIIIESICVNSTAHLERNQSKLSRPLGNPTEGALLLWLEDKQIDYLPERAQFLVIDQLTFSPERKYMATLGVSGLSKKLVLHFKGAPEKILAHCQRILTSTGVETIDPKIRQSLQEELQVYEAKGKRTLAFAYLSEVIENQPSLAIEKHSPELIWLGFVAISDPVRDKVPQAIAKCQQAGIEIKMITGDSYLTALEIAHEIGILPPHDHQSYLTGAQLRVMNDTEAQKALKQAKVIARARPQDKQRIVKLLQDAGEIVAVTGDGTNDAAALKQAQVGLSMGKIGTSVAKEASDIVILDDSFCSIELGVMWGRSLYQNIQKFILFQLTINVAACGIALLGPFMGINLPLTVIQLLWINLIMDTFAALALATEPPTQKVMEIPPRRADEFILSRSMMLNLLTMAPIFLLVSGGFLMYIQQDGIVNPYELSLFFTTFVMLQFWNLFNAKTFGLQESAFAHFQENPGFIAIALVILGGQILMVQFGGEFFRTVPLLWQHWSIIIGSTSIILWLGEIRRFLARLKSCSQKALG